jgi:hypothetical protein
MDENWITINNLYFLQIFMSENIHPKMTNKLWWMELHPLGIVIVHDKAIP